MIKAIIFDFDGVLADLKDVHFDALNFALHSIDPKFVISKQEHISIYDGLGTLKKLSLLKENKGLKDSDFSQIYDAKQQKTVELISSTLRHNTRLVSLFKLLKNDYKIYVASNAIRQTIEIGLDKIGILNYCDGIFSNQDVDNQKPHPEMYLRCMIASGAKPKETLIIEDSKTGRKGAAESGAYVCGVDDVDDVTIEKIQSHISLFSNTPIVKWAAKDTNILIPMAGAGSRFKQQGYKNPKPLIDVNGVSMIQKVVENLNIDGNFIFVVQEEHYEQYNLNYLLRLIAPGCTIIKTDGLTEGAACTTLLAKEYIDSDKHLVIANSDQFVEWDSSDFFYNMIYNDYDGGILTFEASESKWSYAKTDDMGFVTEVAEKKVISNEATVGIYYWKHGKNYVQFAEQMIQKNIRVNNEFYVCPVFNEAISCGKKIKTFQAQKMWGMGTPEDLKHFLENFHE